LEEQSPSITPAAEPWDKHEYGAARSELIDKAVVLTDGKAGTVENVWLDELHGLRISIEGHEGRWPVSTIKFES
jgi:hypothetical protein